MTESDGALKFIAFVDCGYVEEAERLWGNSSGEILGYLQNKGDLPQLYKSIQRFSTNGFADKFYDVVTRIDRKSARDLIVSRRFGPDLESSY